MNSSENQSSSIPNVNAELNISDYTSPIKLHFQHEKFWHVWLSPSNRCTVLMRTGKIVNQISEDDVSALEHEKTYPNERQAVAAIQSHIAQKRLKGYELYLSNPKKRKLEGETKVQKNYKENEDKYSMVVPQGVNCPIFDEKNYRFSVPNGEYLESPIDGKDFNYFQLEVQENFLKIRKGKTSFPSSEGIESTYHQYSSESEAKSHAIRFIGEKIALGFTRNKAKFRASFTARNLQEFKEAAFQQVRSQTESSQSQPQKSLQSKKNNVPSITVNNPELNRQSLASFSKPNAQNATYANNELRNNNFLNLPHEMHRQRKDNYSITSKISDLSDLSEEMRSNASRSRSPSPSNHSGYSHNSPDDSVEVARNGNTKLGTPISKTHDVLLAETWEEKIDPTGYLMSEKLDGVRCLWSGKRLYSRNGNQFFCPEFFTRGWPNAVLDGELWIARNTFQQCVRVVKKKTPDENEWRKIKYLVFDAPSLKLPFSERYRLIEEEIGAINNAHITAVPHRICTSRRDMDSELDKVLKLFGEGLMLRNPKSMYEMRRSMNLLKVKKMLDDEALVIGFIRRPTGDIKAMKVRLKNGKEFKIGGGLTDQERRDPPKIGSMVTFKYQNLSEDGIPRFPIYLRPYDKI